MIISALLLMIGKVRVVSEDILYNSFSSCNVVILKLVIIVLNIMWYQNAINLSIHRHSLLL